LIFNYFIYKLKEKRELPNLSILKTKLNIRNNFVNDFLKSKKFKNFADVEDSINNFNKTNEISDFSQLNILYEMKIEEILNSLNNIKIKGIIDFLSDLNLAKKLLFSIRKIICRNLNKNNSQLLTYGCDVIMIDILNFFSENKINNLNDIEYSIIVN